MVNNLITAHYNIIKNNLIRAHYNNIMKTSGFWWQVYSSLVGDQMSPLDVIVWCGHHDELTPPWCDNLGGHYDELTPPWCDGLVNHHDEFDTTKQLQ